MEEKLLNELQLFCHYKCKYHKNTVQESEICDECDEEVIIEVSPCQYCQTEEFIREVRDRL